MTNSMSRGDEERNSADVTNESPRPAHTPLPWRVQKEVSRSMWETHSPETLWQLYSEVGCENFYAGKASTEANAEFIVRAANSHDALVQMLWDVRDELVKNYSEWILVAAIDRTLALAEGTSPERETETSANR